MLIDCPACARSYHVSRAEIGENGRTVICPRCDAHWFVYSDGTNTLMPSPEDLQTPSYSARPAVTPFDVEPRPSSIWRAARPALVGVACIILAMGAIGQRQRIVKTAPRLAALYAGMGLPVNVRGLEIAALMPDRPDAVDISVSGAIRNVAQRRVPVPRLVYEIRDAEGAAIASWTEKAPAKTLGMGKTLAFASSPHELPPDSHSILVHFEDDDATTPIRLARRAE